MDEAADAGGAQDEGTAGGAGGLSAARRPGRPLGRRGPYRNPRHAGWSDAVAAQVVARVGNGATLAGIGAEPGMPATSTLKEWMRKYPDFAYAVREARRAFGRRALVDHPGYCRAAAEAIFERLCEGEGLASICRDDTMPAHSCVYRWLKDNEEFRAIVELARMIQGDRLAEIGWEMALAGTPERAYLTDVQLRHLRWYAAKVAPRKYGAIRPAEAWEAAGAGRPPAREATLSVRFVAPVEREDAEGRPITSWWDPDRGVLPLGDEDP